MSQRLSNKEILEKLKKRFENIENNNNNEALVKNIYELCNLLKRKPFHVFPDMELSVDNIIKCLLAFGKSIEHEHFYYLKLNEEESTFIGNDALKNLRNGTLDIENNYHVDEDDPEFVKVH